MEMTRLLSITATAGMAAVLAGCGTGEASTPTTEETAAAAPVPVETTLADRGDIFAIYEATATMESDIDAPVPARVDGDVVKILVEEGDVVSRGDVLARLDGERLKLEMLSAKANLDRVRGEYERLRELRERNLVSATMYDGLRYDVDALEAAYRLATLNYGYSAIRAPISGVVSERTVKLGENIASGEVAFRITDTRELLAYLQIPQTELAKFEERHTATLRVDSLPGDRFDAEIVRVSPTIDTRNGTFRATAAIDNAAGMLAPGMFARFTIAYEKHEDVVIVPAKALVVEDNETMIYVVANGEVDKRTVETGVHSNGRVEVLQGLDGNEEVVVVGQSSLREGSKVLASTATVDSFIG
jgi:membrane fusion protein (multidrug efflux system)